MLQSILDKEINVSVTYGTEFNATYNRAVQLMNETLPSMAQRWLEYADIKDKSFVTYRTAFRMFWEYLQINGIEWPERKDVVNWRDYLQEVEGKKATTAKVYLAALKLFFSWTEQERIYPNIAKNVKNPQVKNGHKKDYLTAAQVKSLLNCIDRTTRAGKRDYAIILLMTTTGLREISIVNANVGDISVCGDSAALYYKGKARNNDKEDLVRIPAKADEAIRDYLTVLTDKAADSPLFRSEAHRNAGQRMTERSIGRMVSYYMALIGIKSDRITPHSLRHTAATLNLLNGGTLEETQEMLGHKDINTTMIYVHTLGRAANNSEQRTENAIFA